MLGILFTSLLSLFGFTLLGKLMWSAYIFLTILMTTGALLAEKHNVLLLILPFLFVALHLSYGIGTLVGLLKMPTFKKTYKKER